MIRASLGPDWRDGKFFATAGRLWYQRGMIRIAALAALAGLTALAALAARANADDAGPGALRIEVAVGQTVERDVGFAIGLLCDDLSILHAELRARTPESNTFSVTGVQEGTTMCRVGTAPARPSYVFE